MADHPLGRDAARCEISKSSAVVRSSVRQAPSYLLKKIIRGTHSHSHRQRRHLRFHPLHYFVVIDMAVIGFANAMRIRSVVGNTALIIESDSSANQDRARWKKIWRLAGGHIWDRCRKHEIRLRELLLPLAKQFHQMASEAVDSQAAEAGPAVAVERTTPREIRLVTAERGSREPSSRRVLPRWSFAENLCLEPPDGRIAQLSPRWQQIAYARAHAAWCQWLRHWHLTGKLRALRQPSFASRSLRKNWPHGRQGPSPRICSRRAIARCRWRLATALRALARSLGFHIKTRPPAARPE